MTNLQPQVTQCSDVEAPRAKNGCERNPSQFAQVVRAAQDRTVVLTGGGPLPWIMVNALAEHIGPVTVLEEDKEPLSTMVRRRAKMLGWTQTLGQVAFGIWLKLLHKHSSRRKYEIVATEKLNPQRPRDCLHIKIGNVNSERCRAELQRLKPDVVVVIGTRMIKSETLRCVDATFLNYHAGINPKYRGMNGGYWAMANDDSKNFGITVHLVDDGVDTGKIVAYGAAKPSRKDNFVTFPLVQAAAGRTVLCNAVAEALDGKLTTLDLPLSSQQWFHPTLWGYLWTGLRKGVW